MGFLALRGLLRLLPEHFLPVATVPLDSRVLAFHALADFDDQHIVRHVTGVHHEESRSALLRIASRTGIGARTIRLRQALIAGEVALTVVLLAAAGLLIRTLIHLETMPPGFNPNQVHHRQSISG